MTRQVRVTDKWRKMSFGKYSREWRHFFVAVFMIDNTVDHRSLVSNLFVIKKKRLKMRIRAFGVRYKRNAMCGHCGLVLVFGDR